MSAEKEYADQLVKEFMYLFSDKLENPIAPNEAAQCAILHIDNMLDTGNEHFFIRGKVRDMDFLRATKFELTKI